MSRERKIYKKTGQERCTYAHTAAAAAAPAAATAAAATAAPAAAAAAACTEVAAAVTVCKQASKLLPASCCYVQIEEGCNTKQKKSGETIINFCLLA